MSFLNVSHRRYSFVECQIATQNRSQEIMGVRTWMVIAGTENGVQRYPIYGSGWRGIARWKR
jgi:hypothetical protein